LVGAYEKTLVSNYFSNIGGLARIYLGVTPSTPQPIPIDTMVDRSMRGFPSPASSLLMVRWEAHRRRRNRRAAQEAPDDSPTIARSSRRAPRGTPPRVKRMKCANILPWTRDQKRGCEGGSISDHEIYACVAARPRPTVDHSRPPVRITRIEREHEHTL